MFDGFCRLLFPDVEVLTRLTTYVLKRGRRFLSTPESFHIASDHHFGANSASEPSMLRPTRSTTCHKRGDSGIFKFAPSGDSFRYVQFHVSLGAMGLAPESRD